MGPPHSKKSCCFKLTFVIVLVIGDRKNVRKILFLLTDGVQNPKVGEDGKPFDPVAASQPLYDRGKWI